MSATECHRLCLHFRSPLYFRTLHVSICFRGERKSTRENETDEIGKDLTAIVKENEEEINESDTECKENFRYTCFLFELDDRGIFG
jgi:hypothetical protein